MLLQSRGTWKEETHLEPATCSAFSLLLQVLSRRSPARLLHVPYPWKPYTHSLFPPTPLLLCSKTGAIPHLAYSMIPPRFPSSSALLSDLNHPGCCRRKRQQLRKPAADAAHVSNENMDSVRDSRCYFIFLTAANVTTLKKMYYLLPKCSCNKSKVLHSRDNGDG